MMSVQLYSLRGLAVTKTCRIWEGHERAAKGSTAGKNHNSYYDGGWESPVLEER